MAIFLHTEIYISLQSENIASDKKINLIFFRSLVKITFFHLRYISYERHIFTQIYDLF